MSAGPLHSSSVHYGCGTIKQKLPPSFLGQLSGSVAKYGESWLPGPALS